MRLFCISRYSSSIGSWEPGQEIDVKDEVAELLLRDSPGSFDLDPPKPAKKAAVPVADEEEGGDGVERAPTPGVAGAVARPQRKAVSR